MQQLLFRNGGARRGAGRKRTGSRARIAHRARPIVKSSNALHITLRVMPDVLPLRRRDAYGAIRGASAVTARQQHAFRIVHLSIQNNHVHMIAEADDGGALARGMRSFQTSAARRLNALRARTGRVFADRLSSRRDSIADADADCVVVCLVELSKARRGSRVPGGVGGGSVRERVRLRWLARVA